MLFKLFQVSAIVICISCAVSKPGHAAIITAQDAFDNWNRLAEPINDASDHDNWEVSTNGEFLRYSDSTPFLGGILASDFSLSGDFSFTVLARRNVLNDNRYGLVFGLQDASNHYRLGWEGFENAQMEVDGSTGLSLMREVGGVSTQLVQLDTYWGVPIINATYEITVGRSGNNIFFEINNVTTNSLVASDSVEDTTFMNGSIGVWNTIQPVTFNAMEYDDDPPPPSDVPEPTSLATLGGLVSLFGLGYLRSRRKQAA